MDKTITGCTVGKPIIFGVKMNDGGKWNNFIKVKSGANMITAPNNDGLFFALGNEDYAPASLVVVPTATTVVVTIIMDSSEFYCYQ